MEKMDKHTLKYIFLLNDYGVRSDFRIIKHRGIIKWQGRIAEIRVNTSITLRFEWMAEMQEDGRWYPLRINNPIYLSEDRLVKPPKFNPNVGFVFTVRGLGECILFPLLSPFSLDDSKFV